MADEERDQEKKNKNKRVRNEDGDVDRDRLADALPSFKKIHIHYSKPEDDLTSTLGAYSSSSDDSNSPNEAGVFDFPWLKEGTTMKSDLNFEDAFASSLDATNVSEMFDADDDKLIVTEKCGSHEAEEKDNRVSVYSGYTAMSRKQEEEEDDDGLECVWDSLLNQKPLSNIEFEAGGGF